ncbi:DUF5681 domain-containing protein [Luteolibacter flavescens]|uniref:DUF5681 domain-containing protein n=1 Tax=Luteolibacter flavescens TaxID=1859460 RepID=A0ABT3FHR7_9BACT|nr:DUF5681 domain-containing protein [Luteolibacter flavescens]MCW1883108.1 DUF5681 domain-containing protein [Luteolibacter flavescens]
MKSTFPDDDDDNEVGYRKPPKGSRFKKGQSGNPLGRPKKKRTNAELLNDLLEEKIKVGDKIMTKRQALYLSLVNDAIKGKASARNTVLALVNDEEVELEEFEETLDDKIAFFEVQRLMSKREKEDK